MPMQQERHIAVVKATPTKVFRGPVILGSNLNATRFVLLGFTPFDGPFARLDMRLGKLRPKADKTIQ